MQTLLNNYKFALLNNEPTYFNFSHRTRPIAVIKSVRINYYFDLNGSDHIPLIINTVTISAAANLHTPQKLNYHKTDWTKYDILKYWNGKENMCWTKTDINTRVDHLTKMLVEIAYKYSTSFCSISTNTMHGVINVQ